MSGCQRLAIRRRASWTPACRTAARAPAAASACSMSNTVGITSQGTEGHGAGAAEAGYPPRSMSAQYIFTMHRLSRSFPPDKEVLRTSRCPSTRARRSACWATTAPASRRCCGSWPGPTPSTAATAQLAPSASVGMLEQEPHLDEAKDVRGNVEDGVAELRGLLDRFNELSMNYSDETADEFARLQEQIDAADAWNLDTMLDIAMDALRLPARRRRRHEALRRRAPPRRAVPPAAARARPAAARRADQPPRRRVGRVAGDAPEGVQRARSSRHPRSLLPRQRRRLDPRAGPRPRDPLRGQLQRLADPEAGAPRAGGALRQDAQTHDREGAGVGADERVRPPREAEGAPQRLRAALGRGAQRQARRGADPHPRRAAAGRGRDRGRGAAQGLRREAADRGPDLQAAARPGSSA